ncbi:DUF4403 domain-containing protein containing protein [Pelomyxa schiedti]|nr:DUF4403 domain-containing protein containing protein [Pelomyxa schiedti]
MFQQRTPTVEQAGAKPPDEKTLLLQKRHRQATHHGGLCEKYGTKKVVFVSTVVFFVVAIGASVFAACWFLIDWQGLTKLKIPAPSGFSNPSVVVQGRDSTISVHTDINLFSLVVPHRLDKLVSLDDGSLHYVMQSDGSPEGTTVTIDIDGDSATGHATCTVSSVSSLTQGSVKLDISCSGKAAVRKDGFETVRRGHTQIAGDFAATLFCTVAVSLTNDWRLIGNPSVDVALGRMISHDIFGDSFPGIFGGWMKSKTPQIEAWMAERFSQSPMRERLNRMWQRLNDAIQINTVELPDHKAEGVWLQLNPNALSVSPLTFSGVWMHVSMDLSCKPVIALGYKPASSSPVAGCPSFSSVISDRGIDAALAFHLPYTALHMEASRLLPFVITPDSIYRAKITVKSVQLYPSGRMIVVTVDVDALSRVGNATGVLYLWGELQWNSASSTLSVTDVDFHPETKQYINKVFLCTGWLLHDSLKEFISNQLSWNLGPHLEKLRQHLSENHRSYSWVDNNFDLHNLDLQSVVADDSGITLMGSITGQGSLSLKPLR